MHDVEVLIDSGRRLLVIETEREGCFIEGFRRIGQRSTKAYYQWTITQGLLRLAHGYQPQKHNKDIDQLFGQILSTQHEGVFVLVDYHHFLKDPVSVRYIKDVILNAPKQNLILLSQKIDLPDELKAMATHYSLPLPTFEDMTKMVNELASQWKRENGQSLKVTDKNILKQLLKNLCGLSHDDAYRMARHAIWNDGIINQTDIIDVAKRKFELLNQDNVLNLEIDYEELKNIAGFNTLKKWLSVRRKVFKGEIALPGGDKPKGMLLLGVQGCGKSMAAKAVAGSWNLPLLHLDFGTLYNRFYGQTEENMRQALEIAEKMEPCILWLDEIEKGMSAVSSSDDVSKRLLGTFLTWLAEKKSSVFVVATANDVSKLPPELMRKGRFDEIFFVDLPNSTERQQIIKIHLERRKQSTKLIDINAISEITEGFSGAELEQLIVSAQYHTYSHDEEVDTKLLKKLVQETQPLSVLMHEKITQLQQWAQGRTTRVN